MELTAAQLAAKLGGVVEGDADVIVRGLAELVDAGEGDLCFLADPRFGAHMAATGAAAVLVDPSWRGDCAAALVRVENPNVCFARAAALFAPDPTPRRPGIDATAVVADGVELGVDVHVGPHCVIEPGVKIGDRTVIRAGCSIGEQTSIGADGLLYPHVTVRDRVRIGDRVILHSGAVIGSDGFGYLPGGEGWVKIPQIGTVAIGHDVEIGANATIDRARFGKTVIGDGVKIDNLVQVAHNCRIGPGTAIAAQVGIAGSTDIGAAVQMGGQAGVAGHVRVGDGVVVGGRAGITKDVPPQTFVSGFPAMPHSKARRIHAHTMRLPDLRRKVEDLARRLAALEQATGVAEEDETA